MTHGIYAGSFDPITNGHVWMIEQGVRLFDRLTVAVADNPDKRYAFTELEVKARENIERHVTELTQPPAGTGREEG